MDVGRLLRGVTGEELERMSDRALDERGVPFRMRAYLREKLLSRADVQQPVSVEEQVRARARRRQYASLTRNPPFLHHR